MSDYMSQFIAFLHDSGFEPAEKIKADDKMHRLKQKGDSGAKTSAQYIFRINEAGAIGRATCFKRNEVFNFCAKNKSKRTPEESAAIRESIEKERRERKEKVEAEKRAAKEYANKVWKKAAKKGDHPYLIRKKIPLIGSRIYKDEIIVPLYNEEGEIVNIQAIRENKECPKKFLSGAQAKGVFCPLLRNGREEIYIVEGYATGVTLFLALEKTVLCAMYASNILDVARIARKKYPESKIVIAADNDYENKENTGVKAGLHAAQAINGECVWPKTENDWNDVYIKHGLESVKTAIMGSLPRS